MISDLFSPKARAFPISIFFASGMMGAGGSFIVGGAVVAAMTALVASGILPSWAQPWRLTFIAVGIPGLLFALLILRSAERSVGRAWASRSIYRWSPNL